MLFDLLRIKQRNLKIEEQRRNSRQTVQRNHCDQRKIFGALELHFSDIYCIGNRRKKAETVDQSSLAGRALIRKISRLLLSHDVSFFSPVSHVGISFSIS